MKERKELKATMMTVGASLLVWSVQQLIQASYIEGVIGVVVAGGFFWGYEYVQEIEKYEVLDDIAANLDDKQIQDLIERVSDGLRDSVDEIQGGVDGGDGGRS